MKEVAFEYLTNSESCFTWRSVPFGREPHWISICFKKWVVVWNPITLGKNHPEKQIVVKKCCTQLLFSGQIRVVLESQLFWKDAAPKSWKSSQGLFLQMEAQWGVVLKKMLHGIHTSKAVQGENLVSFSKMKLSLNRKESTSLPRTLKRKLPSVLRIKCVWTLVLQGDSISESSLECTSNKVVLQMLGSRRSLLLLEENCTLRSFSLK